MTKPRQVVQPLSRVLFPGVADELDGHHAFVARCLREVFRAFSILRVEGRAFRNSLLLVLEFRIFRALGCRVMDGSRWSMQGLDCPSRMKAPKPNVQGYNYRVIFVHTAISSQ